MIYTNMDLKALGLDKQQKSYRHMGAPDMAKAVRREKALVLDTETYGRGFDRQAFVDKYLMDHAAAGKKVTATTMERAAAEAAAEAKARALDPMRANVRLVQLATRGGDIYIVDTHVGGAERVVMAASGKPIAGQNLKFDLKMVWAQWPGFEPSEVWDTMAAHRMATASESTTYTPADLKSIVARWANVDLDKGHGGDDWSGPITQDMFRYAYLDVAYLWRVVDAQAALLDERSEEQNEDGYFLGMLYDKVAIVEMRFVAQLARTELRGIPMNSAWLRWRAAEIRPEVERLEAGYVKKGVNVRSPAQLLAYLHKRDIDVMGTAYEDLVPHLDVPLVAGLLRLKDIQKELSMIEDYIERVDASPDGRIRPSFNQQRALDGRMSCSKPNMQQIKRSLKGKVYAAPAGRTILKADYPGIEARIMAVIARDTALLGVFKTGGDMHVLTGKQVFGLTAKQVNESPDSRKKVKSANFGLMFGMGAQKFTEYAFTNYGVVVTLAEAQKIRAGYLGLYRGIKSLHDRNSRALNQQPSIVLRTLLGRRMKVDRFTNANNYPVQGSAADMLKLASSLFASGVKAAGIDAGIINYVHDELVVECAARDKARAKAALSKAMETAANYVIQLFPTKVEVEEVPTQQPGKEAKPGKKTKKR